MATQHEVNGGLEKNENEIKETTCDIGYEKSSDNMESKIADGRGNEKAVSEENSGENPSERLSDTETENQDEETSATTASLTSKSSSQKEPIATNHERPDPQSQENAAELQTSNSKDSLLMENTEKEFETVESNDKTASKLDNPEFVNLESLEGTNTAPQTPDDQMNTPSKHMIDVSTTSHATTGSPSPSHGSLDKVHHTGLSHKFSDEESRAEYLKIKSEVTGEAETSESEDEEEQLIQHHGSHHSPDAQTRAEYRKIKFEVTGDSQTSESEDDDDEMPGLIEDVKATENKKAAESTAEASTSSEEWTDILGNGLLMKRILRTGKGRETRPDRGQIVMLRTAGRLEDGTGADWNQCIQFILGDGEVIQAWDLAVALMELEEVCELTTDARYAYGEHGREECTPPVPPNAKITYELELMTVRDGPDLEVMDDEERVKIGDKKRELGNELYVKGDYSAAINSYQRALKYLNPSSSEKVQELKVKCWNNMAAAQLKVKAYNAALTSCSQVLQVSPDNVKAIFRKGKVLAAQGELSEALPLVKKANQLDPNNKTIRAELTSLRKRKTAEDEKERTMYQRMVGGLGGDDKETPKKTSGVLSWSLLFGATVVALGGILAAIYISRH